MNIFSGEISPSNGRKDIEWIRPDGQEMQLDDWNNPSNHILAYIINGNNDKSSKTITPTCDDDFMILMSGNTFGVVDFKLPPPPNKQKWELVFDTTGKHKKINDDGTYSLDAYSYVLLKSHKNEYRRTLVLIASNINYSR